MLGEVLNARMEALPSQEVLEDNLDFSFILSTFFTVCAFLVFHLSDYCPVVICLSPALDHEPLKAGTVSVLLT